MPAVSRPSARPKSAAWRSRCTRLAKHNKAQLLVIADEIIFALMAFLIAIGVVVILGAVTGIVWQERGLSFAAAFKKLRPGR